MTVIAANPGGVGKMNENREDPSFLVYTRQKLDGSTELQELPLDVSQ
jgi:hypothetical protein